MIPYAQALSILPDPAGQRNHRNTARNKVGVRRFLEETCSQDGALSSDTIFFSHQVPSSEAGDHGA